MQQCSDEANEAISVISVISAVDAMGAYRCANIVIVDRTKCQLPGCGKSYLKYKGLVGHLQVSSISSRHNTSSHSISSIGILFSSSSISSSLSNSIGSSLSSSSRALATALTAAAAAAAALAAAKQP